MSQTVVPINAGEQVKCATYQKDQYQVQDGHFNKWEEHWGTGVHQEWFLFAIWTCCIVTYVDTLCIDRLVTANAQFWFFVIWSWWVRVSITRWLIACILFYLGSVVSDLDSLLMWSRFLYWSRKMILLVYFVLLMIKHHLLD